MTRIRIAQAALVLVALLIAVFVISGGASYTKDDACRDYSDLGITCDD